MTRALGVIVGRGASERLPGKALREIGGVPLVGWTARAAAAATLLSDIIISTDQSDIAVTAQTHGVSAPFLRPKELAGRNVGNDQVLAHALDWMEQKHAIEYEVVVLIQPTVPFLQPSDIDGCIASVVEQSAGCCFTAVQAEVNPEGSFRQTDQGIVEPVIPGPWLGKDKKKYPLAPAYRPNGALWAIWAKSFRDDQQVYTAPIRLHEMVAERSIDIDYEHDLLIADAIHVAFGFSPAPQIKGPLSVSE